MCGGDPGEDEGPVVLQTGSDAERDPVEQQRPHATRLDGAIGDVECGDAGERQRDVERREVTVADVEEGDRQGCGSEEARQPSVRAAAKLEDEQHGEAAKQRIEDTNPEISGRLVLDEKPCRRNIEIKVRPVGKVRIQDAVEDAHGAPNRDVFVWTVEGRQPEVDPPEP